MSEKLYDMMDWPEIEAVVYSEESEPKNILGPRKTEEGILIQCFLPGAKQVKVLLGRGKPEYEMELQDEAGFFSVLIPGSKIPKYKYEAVYGDGKRKKFYDPYAFEKQISVEQEQQFAAGICYDSYEKLGAHPMTLHGVEGVYFAVWAPNAMRVSVVGDFNKWDGRVHQMNRLNVSGIFELFIPGLKPGALYKYEIKAKGSLVYLKADPYGNQAELRPKTASVVADLSQYTWQDSQWLKERKQINRQDRPLAVYEMHLGSWRKPEEEGRLFYSYRELAPMVAEYVKEMGYTHVELMPVMEHPLDESWGYQVTGYYAPTSRYGSCEDFMYFVDYLHQQGIGVILDWVPAHFPKDTFGMSNFDGTCLYEHLDPRQGMHPHWGTLIYNYGRPQVKNFLIANALFWAEKYHADGIRMDAVASMLYLDYGKNDGEWIANIYGGNENLEAVEFLKHLNSIFKKKHPDVLLIAEESTAWPQITGKVEADGLGFDYKWNMGWMNDFIDYMQKDPIFRAGVHDELTFSMVYAYSEKFLLSLSHDEVVHGKGSLLNKMPGDKEKKLANLRAAYGFMLVHPGKKLLFMGQEFAQEREWSEQRELDWSLLEEKEHKQMQDYVKALWKLYKEQPALYEEDYEPEGFSWINHMDSERNMLTLIRKGKKKEDTLVVVCNFSALDYDKYQMGVPYPGKYKEIFNSDAEAYGGSDVRNSRVKTAKKAECDEREHSIVIHVAPLAVQIFSYTKPEPKKAGKKTEAVKKVPVSKVQKKLQKVMEEEWEKADAAGKQITEEVKPDATKKSAEAPKLETTKKEPLKLETDKKESLKLETAKTEPLKLNTEKKEALKLETAKTEPLKLKTDKTEALKLETTKTEVPKLETADRDLAKPASKRKKKTKK